MVEMPVKQSTAIPVTINTGESVSDSADLTAGSVLMITCPTNWTPANVSFLVSQNNIDFYDLFDVNGVEIIKSVVAGSAILMDASVTQTALYARLRSGSRDYPVPQKENVSFKLMIG